MESLSNDAIRAIVQRYAALLARLREEVGVRPLVLPNGEWFPDRFAGDEPSVQDLVRRAQLHAGLDDIPITARVLPMEGHAAASEGGCSSGSCAAPVATTASELVRLVDTPEGWLLHLFEPEVRHPVVLATLIARALGQVFLLETLEEGQPLPAPAALNVELAAVALGLGVLLLQGSHIYSKSCGGPSVAQVTQLGPAQLAVATAVFAALGRHSSRSVARHLEATQQAAFSEATAWVAGNAALIEALRSDPRSVAEGRVALAEPRPWLLRVLGKRRSPAADEPPDMLGELSEEQMAQLERSLPAAASSPAARSKRPDPHRDELRALVDEALGVR